VGKRRAVETPKARHRDTSPERASEKKAQKTYFIYDGEYIKIGRARSPRHRLKELQTGNPRELRLLVILPTDREAEYHKRFSHLRVKGTEWHTPAEEIWHEVVSLQQAEEASSSAREAEIALMDEKRWGLFCAKVEKIIRNRRLKHNK
jgi:hypothetical protein